MRLVRCLTISGAIAFTGSGARAQIIPDNTLGSESSLVKPGVNVNGVSADRIDGGATRGANLFHSFQQFNVGERGRVYFALPAGIENIFSRVTGKTPSNILGTLGVLGNANLFLLNPNGIIFGPHAQLDVRGSFVASTANSLQWNNNTFFSATNPTAPPLLTINVPIGLQFGTQQPAPIVNAAGLSVPQGQNLSLLGGTVVSTGQLAAPGGQLSVASVPGYSAVQLSPSGVPLSISPTPPNPQVATANPPDLSQLVNGAGSGIDLGVSVNGSGEVKLAASGRAVADGDVVVQQLTSGNATLSAAKNLILESSQLHAEGSLQLLARSQLLVRDSAANPFVAKAGGDLLLQGNQVDIFALNHPESGFFSGGNIVFRSPNPVGGDSHYTTGGNFRIEQPNGSLGNLSSPGDPVIRASGDVSFGSYIGGSLHIFAGGSVTIPSGVAITAADRANGIVDNVTLSDGTTLSINGRTQPTLDVRAGTTAVGSAGILVAVPPLGTFHPAPPNPTGTPTSANITIGSITNSGGLVFLTNQYKPNSSLPGGAINVGAITTGSQSGNGGSVIIDSRSTIALKDTVNTSSGNLIQGKGGDITLSSNGDITTAEILSLGGLGGNINLTSNGKIAIAGHPISTISFTPVLGTRGGDINIKAGSVSLTDGTLAVAATGGAARGGNVNVTAKESVEASGIDAGGIGRSALAIALSKIPTASAAGDLLRQNPSGGLYALTIGAGAAGDINIQTGRLVTQDGARVGSYTQGRGHGGNVTVKASEAVQLSGTRPNNNGGLFADTYIAGDAGNLTVETKRLIVRDGALVSASNVNGRGNGGDLTVNAEEAVELGGITGQNRYNSGLGIYARGTGNSGNLTVNTRRLSLQDGAFIATATFNTGQGGNLTLNVGDSIEVSGSSSVNGSTIPSALSADTFGQMPGAGKAGNLRVSTGRLIVRDGAIVSASSFGYGQGGSLRVDAYSSVELSGAPSGLYAQGFGAGDAGNLTVTTQQLTVQNGAKVTVATGTATSDLKVTSGLFDFGGGLRVNTRDRATGNAGTMNITANSIRLDGGQLIAQTASGEGGDINLQARDLLLMRRNSLISTDARSGTGNGGNMDINTQFIVAVPSENSDITANAFQGRGGNIKITTSSIYGLQFRPLQTPLSDITASSKYGLNGVVQINTLDLDPSKRIVALPENVVDVSRLVASGCGASARQQPSRFVVTGRGGVPSSPNETLRSYDVLVDLGSNPNGGNTRVSNPEHTSTVPQGMLSTSPQHKGKPAARIVEATGWVIGAKGEVILTANPPAVSSHGAWHTTPSCQMGNR